MLQPRTLKSAVIYLEMASRHRVEIANILGSTLVKAGVEVLVVCEKEIAFQYSPITPVVYLDNSKNISTYIEGYLPLLTLRSYCGTLVRDLEKAEENRFAQISNILEEQDPDLFIIWSGNFHYQEGTLKAIQSCGFQDKTLFSEVGWFTQKEFIYFDHCGVNAKSSLLNQERRELNDLQLHLLENQMQRYANRCYSGALGKSPRAKRIFVPLQVDTDTNIQLNSPFKSMAEFISFLEQWVPDDYEVVFKAHPKASYDYILGSSKSNFRFYASGSIEDFFPECDYVLGINSTVLIEAAMLGIKAIAFGKGIFTGNQIVLEANPSDNALSVLEAADALGVNNSFFYELLFERQVSLIELEKRNFSHLFNRHPFDRYLPPNSDGYKPLFYNASEGKSVIKIGHSKIAKTASLDAQYGGQIIVGDNSEVRHHAVLEVSAKYDGLIQIGDRSVVGVANWFQGSGKIFIGDDVIIGPYVAIVSTNHQYEDLSKPISQQPLTPGLVEIGDGVWIGAHCTIAYNVKIGKHAIVAANSFVNKDVPDYAVVAGSPAKIIKMRNA